VLQPLNDEVRLHIRSASHLWMEETRSILYFLRSESRGNDTALSMLGERFEGVIHSDVYAAYFAVHGTHDPNREANR
jgi:hypothetical protein